jgi:hypothetical protein
VSSVHPGPQDADSRSPRRRFSESTPILGDARADSESGRVPVGSVGPLPILKALAKVVRLATLSQSVSPLRVQVRPTLTPSRSRYACMACQTGSGCSADFYFTTYQQAATHYANSARCNQSSRGIATVVLPSRPTDVEAGGSGAAEAWAGPPRRFGRVPRQRISAGGDIMPVG